MKLHYIKTNVGHFYKEIQNGYYSSFATSCIIDGRQGSDYPQQSGYVKLDKPLQSCQKHEKTYGEIIGYKLKNPELASALIPPALSIEDVTGLDCDGDYTVFRHTIYEDLQNLYVEDRSEPVDHYVDVPFEIVNTQEFEVEGYGKPANMQITISNSQGAFGSKTITITQDLERIVVYDDIERLLTPEPLLYTRPCSLTSKQVYSIVRHHVQVHLDRTVAKITSDYDFCFTVKRIVQIKPYVIQSDVSSPRAKKPKYVNKTVDTKEVEIFEMTWAGYEAGGKGYNNYTCIEGWKANSLQEMQEQIKAYLEDLMYNLNAKVKECECCGGTGHVSNSVKTNQRSFE